MQPGPDGEQVTDFAFDQDSGLLAVGPEPSAVDIISIKYVPSKISGVFNIAATMQVSDLATIPPLTTWRMYFAANAPETGIVNISGNSYSKVFPTMATSSSSRPAPMRTARRVINTARPCVTSVATPPIRLSDCRLRFHRPNKSQDHGSCFDHAAQRHSHGRRPSEDCFGFNLMRSPRPNLRVERVGARGLHPRRNRV